MWTHHFEMEALGISNEQIWDVWADINRWHEWDADIEYARTSQEFKKGCQFELKPKKGPKVTIKIIECEPKRSFTDLTRFPFAKMYGRHEVENIGPGKIRLTTTMTVKGPLTFLWRKLVAQKIADALPEDTARLVAAATARKRQEKR